MQWVNRFFPQHTGVFGARRNAAKRITVLFPEETQRPGIPMRWVLCWDGCLLEMVGKQFKEFPSDINRQGQIQALLRARSNTTDTASDWLHRESAPFSLWPKSWTPSNSVMFPRVMWECENRVRPCMFEIPKQVYVLLWQAKTSKGWSPPPTI